MNVISANAAAWPSSIQYAAFDDRPQDPAAPNATNQKDQKDAASGKDDEFTLFSKDGFTFLDFLDIINPLQHIPIVGTIYRQLTGDQINPGARVLGDTLFFGPIGTVASIGDMLIREATGKDMGEHVVALFDAGTPDKATAAKAAPTVVADAGSATAIISPTEAVDPVTAWAMGEAAYRNAIATKAQTSRTAPAEVVASAVPASPAAFVASADEVREWAALTVSTAPAVNVSDGRTWASLTTPVPAATAQSATAPTEATVRRDRNAAIRDATATIRRTRRSAAVMSPSNFARPAEPDDERKTAADRPAPFGAVAANGGWFTDAMLSAHEKYRNNAGLYGQAPAPAVDLRQ